MDLTTAFIVTFLAVIAYRIIKAFQIHVAQTRYTPRKNQFEQLDHYDIPTELKLNTDELEKCKKNLNTVIQSTQETLDSAAATDKAAVHRILRRNNPSIYGKPLYVFEDDLKEADLTFELIEPQEYANLLNPKFIDQDNNSAVKPNGKIVGFTIGITTMDGMPIAESHGFVDTYDIPPFDTWFYLYKDILLCWIPEEYIVHMQSVMDVEIFDSYFWLEEKHPQINNYLLKKSI